MANNVIGLKAAKHIIIARLSIFSIARESVGITAGLIIDDVVPPCVFGALPPCNSLSMFGKR